MTFIIDGVRDPAEWSAASRLDYAPGASPAGYSLYGTIDGNAFVFSLQSATAINFGTTVWLNTDHNNATGHQIFGNQTGADFNVNFIDDAGVAVPRLYTGASGEVLKEAITTYALSTDKKSVEFKVPFSALGLSTPPTITDVYADVNDSVFLPDNYSLPGFELVDPATLPVRTDLGLKVGIVYSETSAAKFFDKTAYSDLFMSAQNQAMMAGVPYDILTEADLADLAKIVNYDTLIFPSFAHVPLATFNAIQNNLETVTQKYGVGIITAGNFMTNDETGAVLPGDVYARMKVLLGVNVEGATSGASDVHIVAQDVSHPVMSGYVAGETIHDYGGIGTQWFTPVGSNATVLASQVVGTATHHAVLATESGGRNVHFATEGLLADNNMLAHALNWTAQDPTKPSLQLHMSRQAAIVASRNDMDEAMQPDEVNPENGPGIYDVMLPIVQQWKDAYNFVGSYYIDIGDGTNDTGTDWSISKPYYDQLLAMGNEIGSHSMTHPEDTNLLTADQLQYQFQQSKSIIEQNLGIAVLGAAIPGNPEKLPVSQEVMKYYSYLTGGNTAIGAGYPGAFGYMTPGDTQSVYLAPNISSDFTLIGFKQMTAEQASAAWTAEWQTMTAHADLPVIVWPWHDYGPTRFNIDDAQDPNTIPYTEKMYEDFIKTAYSAGSEFVTLADLAQRISASEKATLNYGMVDSDTMNVTVGSAGALGSFALDLDGLNTIKAVTGWYAYDSDSVFLPAGGGSFQIDVGPTPDNVTHISALPSRAQLLTMSGDGRSLDFSVAGEGQVVIDLAQIDLAQYGSLTPVVTGATISSLAGERLELKLTGLGQHDVSVRLPPAEVVQAIAFSADSGASSSDFITNVATQTVTGTLSAALIAGDTVKISVDNGTTWQAATAAVGSTTFSLSGVALTNSGMQLQARVESAAGLASNTLLQPYVLDQTPPSQVVSIISMAKDTGVVGDFVTSDGSADRAVAGTLSTTLAADETLQVSFDGGNTWTSASVTGTQWIAMDSTVHSASWSIQARVADLAGNTGLIASQAVTYDTSNPGPLVSVFRDGIWSQETPTPYSGPVQYLQYQYLGTANGEVIIGTGSNDFVNLLEGEDAANGGSGNDVLDGGTGSNFLTGGAGSDVFFLDSRGGQTTWSTIADWEAGEQLSMWGWRPGISQAIWDESAGATGYTGVTMHGDLDANGAIDTSVTWTGLARGQLPTPVEFDGLLWFK